MTTLGTAGMTSTAPSLDLLGELRQRIDNGRCLLAEYEASDAAWERNADKLKALQATYAAGVSAYRRETDIEEILARARKGLTVLSRLWEDGSTDGSFERALNRYQALMDAIYGADLLRYTTDAQMRLLRTTRDLARKRGRV